MILGNESGEVKRDWVAQYKEMASGPKQASNKRGSALPSYLDEDAVSTSIPTPWQHVMQANASTDTVTSSEAFEKEQDRLVQQEWEEGVRQLQMAFQLVLIPFFGKWLGRRWSYWCMCFADLVFARYIQ